MMKNFNLEIYTDGGARGNPGPAAIGFVIKKDGRVIYKHGEKIGEATNNVAEYTAVLKAFQYLLKTGLASEVKLITFYLDSQLVVAQLSGRYRIKNQKLKILINQIKTLSQKFNCKLNYQQIPRSLNSEADNLVNQALGSR